MEDMNLKARGQSLKTLMDTMDEDEVKRIPKVNISIQGGELGEVEDDSTVSENEDMTIDEDLSPMEEEGGSAFDQLVLKKKREQNGMR